MQPQINNIIDTLSNQFRHQIDFVTLYLTANPLIRKGLIAAAIVVIILVLFSLRPKRRPKTTPVMTQQKPRGFAAIFSNKELTTISGDDITATQLDLAIAYLEMQQPDLAKDLLAQVIKTGDGTQKKEARQLLKKL